jgi:hypothetical protein
LKKTALTLVAALLSITVGTQVVSFTSANPYSPPPFFPPEPNTDPPIITVQSPHNITYYVNDVQLNFTITQPSSWQQDNLTLAYIYKVSYQLDGRTNTMWKMMPSQPPTLPTTQQFSALLNGLSTGGHILQINVTTYSIYDPVQSVDWHFTSEYWMNTIRTISFTVDAGPYPSPSPSPQETGPEPFPTTLVIASIGSVAIVGLGLLVYFKKRQKGSVDKGVELES